MSKHSHSPFQLGEWLVEPDLNCLSKPGVTKQLEPKIMAVLVYLRQRQDEVVSADEIIEQVWDRRPMGDNPLYKAVAKLRRALEDDPNDPQFIVTVSKKGYRLLAPVIEPVNIPAYTPAKSDLPAANIGKNQFRFRRVLSIVMGLAVGAGIAVAMLWRPQPSPLSVRPMSIFPGSHSQPSFAPDSARFAFVGDADGVPNVWVLAPGEAAARQLTHGGSASLRPRWSPDGNTVLFVRDHSLWMIPASGGNEVEIVRNAYNPNWSHDGRSIVFERDHQVWISGADGSQQFRVSGVSQRELPLSPRWPAFSSDDKRIVYFETDDTPLGDLWIIPAKGGDPERITYAPAFGSAPVWSADGASIYYSSQRGGNRTLWQVDVKNKTSTALLVGSGDDDFPDVSADGLRLLYSNSRERFVLVLSDPTTGAEQQLFTSRLPILGPELSPDQTELVFFGSARSGGYQLYTLPLVGLTPRMITSNTHYTHALPRWAADGKSIYYFQTSSESSFRKIDVNGGESELIVDGWNWDVANGARLDPSQEKIIYSQLSGPAPVQTRIRDLAMARDTTFYAALEYPRWSHDGTMILGSLSESQQFPGDVAICPLTGAECDILAKDARIPIWSNDESLVYFVRGFGKSQELFVVPSAGGAEKKLMTMSPLFPLGPFYDVTRDGNIVWVRYEEEAGEIWMVELENH